MKKSKCIVGSENYVGICECEKCSKVNSLTKFAKCYYESISGGYLRLSHFESCTRKIKLHFKMYSDPLAERIAHVEFDNENYRRYLRHVQFKL